MRAVPHTPMRRRIAAHMVESLLHTAPHVTNVFQCDMTAVLADRAMRKADFEQRGLSLTLTAYFVAACVDALRAVPEANARWSENAILLNERLDIGVATALGDRGLVVPVIRDAGALDLAGIAAALGALVDKARQDALTPGDLQGGTFTISNHGVSGSLLAAPIVINQPQSAILGVGKLEKRAVVADRGRARRARHPALLLRDPHHRSPGARRLPGQPLHGDFRAPPRGLALARFRSSRRAKCPAGVSKLKMPDRHRGGCGHVYARP